ncbi:rubrerythrin [Thermococcus sp. GR7]|uniref:ferritin-like domain-containing protein n=1 Tax=unclassified Thermococcus TaxID=2627626 RepID=UPI00143093F4|nr:MULTISPECIES: ferritin family protein [unclassified Thermococcus]NJE47307.1 rubrerythrin [Thermococcus sp. GR7]NJE78672.1 rubrerythrin [Thermococcus sp. GR4]NJF23203.1 rubrerythrin [Thermococcus sp. GR5]
MSKALEMFMEKASINENVMKTLREISKCSLKEILSYIIKGERDATGLYTFLHQNMPEEYAKKKFKEFVEIEESHDKRVRTIFEGLFPGEEPLDMPLNSWAEVLAEKDFRLKNVEDYLTVLRIGMDTEKLSEAIYIVLMERLEDPEHKRIMSELANDERDHYEFLKKEYDFYSKVEAKKSLEELVRELREKKGA